MIKLLIGGSPCTSWSIAQSKNRETTAEGIGWELFRNYLIARKKYQPDYFLYENNKSMAKAIRNQIDVEFCRPYEESPYWVLAWEQCSKDGHCASWRYRHIEGYEKTIFRILINSALVSAQNRQRYYWTDIPGVEQPEDRGILLRDILESGAAWREKSYMIDANYYKGGNHTNPEKQSGQRCMAAEPVNDQEGKARTIKAQYAKTSIANVTYTASYGATMAAEPVAGRLVGRRIGENGRRDDYNAEIEHFQRFEVNADGSKTNTLSTVQKDNMVAEPVCLRYERTDEAKKVRKQYENGEIQHGFNEFRELHPRTDGKSNTLSTVLKDNQICEPVRIGTIESGSETNHDSRPFRVYSPNAKGVTLTRTDGGGGSGTGLYAVPLIVPEATKKGTVEILPGECVDMAMIRSKTRRGRKMTAKSNCLTTSCQMFEYCGTVDKPIYEVMGGYISIKDKTYPIKLADGYYIIRKLTVLECMRLQTVPEWYVFPVSDTQSYKMLGNGWTCDVIAHILSHAPEITTEPVEVLSMYDGMSCGHIALDKLGATVSAYYATEIDKYAIKTTLHNYPDTIQLGDAFQVREDGWTLERTERDG